MRGFLKYLFISEIVILVALVLAFLWVDKSIYNEFISSKVSSLATQNGIPLSLNKPEFFITGLRSNSADFSIPVGKHFIRLQPRDLELETSLALILGKDLSLSLDSKLYGGNLTGEIKQESDKIFKANLKLTGMVINEHPQLAPFGIGSGKLDLELSNLRFNKEIAIDGDLNISLVDFSLPKGLSLEKFGLPAVVPPIKDLNLRTELSLRNSEDKQPNLVIKSLELVSSLIDLELDGDLKFLNNSLNNLRITGNVKLSDELRKIVNMQLILAAVQASGHRVNSNLTKDSNSFTVNVSGLVNKLWIRCDDKKSPESTEDSATTRKLKRSKLKR